VQYVAGHVVDIATKGMKNRLSTYSSLPVNGRVNSYSQHEVFTPFGIECLPAHAGRLNESRGHGRNAVPVFSAPVTAAAAARTAASVFPFETQPETAKTRNETRLRTEHAAFDPFGRRRCSFPTSLGAAVS